MHHYNITMRDTSCPLGMHCAATLDTCGAAAVCALHAPMLQSWRRGAAQAARRANIHSNRSGGACPYASSYSDANRTSNARTCATKAAKIWCVQMSHATCPSHKAEARTWVTRRVDASHVRAVVRSPRSNASRKALGVTSRQPGVDMHINAKSRSRASKSDRTASCHAVISQMHATTYARTYAMMT